MERRFPAKWTNSSSGDSLGARGAMAARILADDTEEQLEQDAAAFAAWPGVPRDASSVFGCSLLRNLRRSRNPSTQEGPHDAKFQSVYLSASIARHGADGGAYSLDAGSPRDDRRLA